MEVVDIIVSVIIGLITGGIYWFLDRRYRISAQKQKIKTINENIENLILREMIRSDRKFGLDDIENITKAQSSMENVDVELLKSPLSIMNEIYYKVLENEYLVPKFKDRLLKRVKEITKKTKIKKEKEIEEIQVPSSPIITLTAIIGAGVSMLISFYSFQIMPPSIVFPDSSIFKSLIIIVAVVTLLTFLTRFLKIIK